ncbi:TOG array regulator of axonemal microtubules protein 1-like [Passer domesticus]|uniref:TOG array regulator of axonemal microtubules protein 1-like n=1 Tax=Passer domesticus TaxID=48849 RepID=UPI0030FED471
MEFTGKGKTSEGKGLSGYPLAKTFSLASPSMLLPSKPLPPIQKSSPSTKPSLICSREQENGKDGIGYAEGRRKEEELSSEGQGHKASLLCSSGGDMKKGSLGPPLIPPIGKAVSPSLGSAAGSLQSSLQLEFQESQGMRSGCSSRSKENSEHAGVTRFIFSKSFRPCPSSLLPSKPLPPIRISSPSSNNNKMYSMEKENKDIGTGYDNDSRKHQEQSSEEKCYKWRGYEEGVIGTTSDPPHRPRSSSRSKEENSEHAGLPLSQAKEMDHHTDPGLTRDTDLREGFGKIRAALCMLAQKNLERKDAELLERDMKKRRQRKTSLQPILETVEPRDEAEASFSLPPVDGTASRVQRKQPGSALKKKVLKKQDNVSLLPNRPIIHGDGSFPCSSSVTSQTATGAQRREEPLRGHGQKDRASPDPQHSLLEALSLLGSDDWEMKEKGLYNIKHLAGSHSEVLLCRLHDVCLAVTNEVANLRSKVSYSAIVTLGELFVTLKKNMDSEVDEVARVLLQMVSNSPEFVQKAASQTLGIMVENVTPARAMTALMDMGVK